MGGCPLHLAVCSGGASTQLFLKMTASQSDERQNASIRDMLEGAGLGWAEGQPPGPVPLAGHGATLANGGHPQSAAELLGKSDEFAH